MATRDEQKAKRLLYDEADEYREKARKKIERSIRKHGEMAGYSFYHIDEKKLDFTNRSTRKEIEAGLNEVKDFIDHPNKYRVMYLEPEKSDDKYRDIALERDVRLFDKLQSQENVKKLKDAYARIQLQGELEESGHQMIGKTVVSKDEFGRDFVDFEADFLDPDIKNINIYRLPTGRIIGAKGLKEVQDFYAQKEQGGIKLKLPPMFEMKNTRKSFHKNLGHLQGRTATPISQKNRIMKRNFIAKILSNFGISDIGELKEEKEKNPQLKALYHLVNRLRTMPFAKFYYLYETSQEMTFDFVYSEEQANNMVARMNTQIDSITGENADEDLRYKVQQYSQKLKQENLI